MKRAVVAVLGLALSRCHAEASETKAGAADRASPAASSSPTAKAIDAGAPPACPAEMTRIEQFCLDRYEAHLVDTDEPEHARDPYRRPEPGARVMARSSGGVVPQAYLSRFEAEAACRAAGKRLCTATEWYRACSGPKKLRYPYGNSEVGGRCNVGKGHVMQKVFGDVRYTFDAHYNSPRLNQEPGFLDLTGGHAECESAEGAYDLVGNLHEWVADDVSANLLRRVPLEIGADKIGPAGNGVFMGGYYSSHGEHGAGCAYATTNHKPDYHDYSIGFRCCADASR